MIAIVSHDAGGAEILSSWLLRNPQPCCLVLEGPARQIFALKLGTTETWQTSRPTPSGSLPTPAWQPTETTLETALRDCDQVLCGTSWASGLERQAIRQAKAAGKPVIAFLDHWSNYRDRFIDNGELCLPDTIWVGDQYAETIATDTFPDTPVQLLENPYFLDIQHELHQRSSRNNQQATPHSNTGTPTQRTILYICEPVKVHALKEYGDERYWGYTEEEAICYFLDNLPALGYSNPRISIRPHPSEPREKYNWVPDQYPYDTATSPNHELLDDISTADIVAGCTSMALVVGLLAGKRVISAIPPGGFPCSLPHTEIEVMQQLLATP